MSDIIVEKYNPMWQEEFNNDIDSYVDGKTELISKFLKKQGMKSSELNRIEAINKK